MRATREASFEELLESGRRRIKRAAGFGITTLEIKSGYGLSVEDELKILKVIQTLAKEESVDIVPTFLGAHTVPPEYADQREAYIDLVIAEMIPEIARQGLATYCDVFCETNVFSVAETRRIFEAALDQGLKLKLHADQLTNTAGTELAVEMGAVSADHLENISEQGIAALEKSSTVAGLLPGCSFFLNMQYPPARKLIERGIDVVLATDFNPGSCMTQNLQLIMSIASTQMRMTPAETIKAVTLNAAKSVERTDIGNLGKGFKADLCLFKIPDYRYLNYNFGQNHIYHVVKDGAILV